MTFRSKNTRPRLDRSEYLAIAREFAATGSALPQTKLLPEHIEDIRSAVKQRDSLKKYIQENLTNEALANRFGVHRRTIEKVISRDTWANKK